MVVWDEPSLLEEYPVLETLRVIFLAQLGEVFNFILLDLWAVVTAHNLSSSSCSRARPPGFLCWLHCFQQQECKHLTPLNVIVSFLWL